MDIFFPQIQTSVNKYHQSFRKHNAMCRQTVYYCQKVEHENEYVVALLRDIVSELEAPPRILFGLHSSKTTSNVFI